MIILFDPDYKVEDGRVTYHLSHSKERGHGTMECVYLVYAK